MMSGGTAQFDTYTNSAGTGAPNFPYGITTTSGVTTITNGNYAILTTDGFNTFQFSTGSSNRTLTLPTAAGNINRIFRVEKIDNGTGQVQIVGTINGSSASTTLNALNYQYGACTIYCDGTSFYYINQPVENGTYTPTYTNGANTSAWTQNLTQFSRVGGYVQVFGNTNVTLTTATNVAFSLTLPIPPTTFTSTFQAGGSCVNFGAAAAGNCTFQALAVTSNTLVSFNTNAGTTLATGVVNVFNFNYRL